MPNSIKYSVSTQNLALRKGNYWIGTGDVGKGPTTSTDYWNGISPGGGYSVYLNKASQGPSIHKIPNDSQMISFTNTIGGQSFTTITQALDWYNSQSDKLVINNLDYPSVITNGLVMNLDATFSPSYPTTGTTWYDLSGNGFNGTLANGASYSSDSGGCISFDGVNDFVSLPINAAFNTASITFELWANLNTINDRHIIMVNWTGNSLEVYPDRSVTMYNYSSQGQVGASSAGGVFSWGSWTHFVGVYDSSAQQLRTYVNGSLVGTRNNSPDTLYSVGVHKISGTDYGGEVSGKISIARHYNRALSTAEVLANYNAQAYLGSPYNPASSAVAILASNPSAPDGYYWINVPNLGVRRIYCLMSQGGWMGMTSEICPQTSNLSTTASWETNTQAKLQGSNSSILNVTVQESGCGSPTYYQLQNPSVSGLSYTESMLLIERVSTIGQCSAISSGNGNGFYEGPEYTGSYTSAGMCTWGDGNFANTCCGAQNMTGLKRYWIMFGSGSNPSLYYQVQCAGGSGQHYHMWFIK